MSKSELPKEAHPKQQALPNVIPELEQTKAKLQIAMAALAHYAEESKWKSMVDMVSWVAKEPTIMSEKHRVAADALGKINGTALSA